MVWGGGETELGGGFSTIFQRVANFCTSLRIQCTQIFKIFNLESGGSNGAFKLILLLR